MIVKGIVEIFSMDVRESSGTSTRDGKAWSIRSQESFSKLGEHETRMVRIRLEDGQKAYPVGKYELLGNMRVGQYGELLAPFDIELVKLPTDAPKAAAK